MPETLTREETIMLTTANCFYRMAILPVLAICAATPALAKDTGFYLGGRAGVGKYPSNSRLILSPNLDLRGRTHDKADLNWSVDVGYRFNRYLGIEVSYADLGKALSRLTDGSGTATAESRFAVKGATLVLIGIFPLGNWEPYVKAGIFQSDTRWTFSGSAEDIPFGESLDGGGTDALFGAGVAYNLTDCWQAKLDLTYFNDAGEPGTGHSEVLSWTAGVVWRL
jgi:opacity protein-like surface antigen